jgi:hypothetical protein
MSECYHNFTVFYLRIFKVVYFNSSNPMFPAPEVNEQTDLIFQLIVPNEEGTTSEPIEVTITVDPIANPPPDGEPRTIGDIIIRLIQNPLDVTNSVESAKERHSYKR